MLERFISADEKARSSNLVWMVVAENGRGDVSTCVRNARYVSVRHCPLEQLEVPVVSNEGLDRIKAHLDAPNVFGGSGADMVLTNAEHALGSWAVDSSH
jgi:hypothetical protein